MKLSLIALPLLAACALSVSACGGGASANGQTIQIRYSHFIPGDVTVKAGEPVTFELRNDDPIEHEWIVGAEDVHERHRTGTEPYHDQVPNEVTIPALSTKLTTLTFYNPGEYLYICHLPGHEAYGMVGTVRVVAD